MFGNFEHRIDPKSALSSLLRPNLPTRPFVYASTLFVSCRNKCNHFKASYYRETRIHLPPTLLGRETISVLSWSLPDLPDLAMDPQEESSSSASSREPVAPQHEDPLAHDSGKTDELRPSNFKTRPTTKLYKSHKVCYSSQYTRPVTELLVEVLEVRYPVPVATEGEERPLLGGDGQREQTCSWLRTLRRYLRRA